MVEGVDSGEDRGDFVGHVLDGLGDTLSEVALFVAVAQFDGFVLAGAGAGGDCGAADGAGIEEDINLDGGIATGVQDLAGLDINDIAHVRVQDSFRKAEGTAHAHERQGSPRFVAVALLPAKGVGPTYLHKKCQS